jgi:hypothetical protein
MKVPELKITEAEGSEGYANPRFEKTKPECDVSGLGLSQALYFSSLVPE